MHFWWVWGASGVGVDRRGRGARGAGNGRARCDGETEGRHGGSMVRADRRGRTIGRSGNRSGARSMSTGGCGAYPDSVHLLGTGGNWVVGSGWSFGEAGPWMAVTARRRRIGGEGSLKGEGEEGRPPKVLIPGGLGARKTPHRVRPKTPESFGKLRTGPASPLGEGEERRAPLALSSVQGCWRRAHDRKTPHPSPLPGERDYGGVLPMG